MLSDLRGHDLNGHRNFPFTKEAFIIVCVKIQRLVRLGFKYCDEDLDELASRLVHVLDLSCSDMEFFMTWKPKAPTIIRHPVLTFKKLTMAIACSDERFDKELADLFEECVTNFKGFTSMTNAHHMSSGKSC